jgi:hypothetical protein
MSYVIQSGGGGGPVTPVSLAPFNAGNVTGFVTFDYNDGVFQEAFLTGNVSIQAPLNPVEGARLELWLKPSGGDRLLDFDAAISIPSDSAISLPKTLSSERFYLVLLKASTGGLTWMLTSLVGGFVG